MISNLLAGAADIGPLGWAFPLEQGLTARDVWPDGRLDVEVRLQNLSYPQFLNPTPVRGSSSRTGRSPGGRVGKEHVRH